MINFNTVGKGARFSCSGTIDRGKENRMKKTVLCILLALAMVLALTACGAKAEDIKDTAAAAEDIVLKKDGLQLTIPAEYADLVIAEAPADDLLFSVSEKASGHFTAPVMPSATCFCRMKKMMTVGSEQNRTLIISAP